MKSLFWIAAWSVTKRNDDGAPMEGGVIFGPELVVAADAAMAERMLVRHVPREIPIEEVVTAVSPF